MFGKPVGRNSEAYSAECSVTQEMAQYAIAIAPYALTKISA
jgi:hypothetical protein